MFSALIKAFTGRAGLLSSLLALAIIALTSAAVLLSLPRIEQKLENSAQLVLSENLADDDSLVSFRAVGRELLLEGQFEDVAGLSAKLDEIEGVHSVRINGAISDSALVAPVSPEAADVTAESEAEAVTAESGPEAVTADSGAEDAQDAAATSGAGTVSDAGDTGNDKANQSETSDVGGTTEAQDVVTSTGLVTDAEENLTASGEPLAHAVPESAEPGPSDVEDSVADGESFDQSSLSLRYNGTQLSLSGHLADEQMAQLIADRVANAVPPYSELETNLDGKGKGSPLNWMREFLSTVADLPDDAQGLIEGSDKLGVQIIPDVEQTLTASAPEEVVEPEQAQELVSEVDADVPTETESSAVSEEEEALPEAAPDEVTSPVDTVVETRDEAVPDSEVIEQSPDDVVSETPQPRVDEVPVAVSPGKYITELNSRMVEQSLFASGDYRIGETMAAELNGLAEMMRQHPNLLLRIVGNLDFSVDQRDAEYVGIDRAREIRDYLYTRRIEPFRVFASPLPRDRAYDKRVQVVFYISE